LCLGGSKIELKMQEYVIEAVGVAGAIAVLLAYGLNTYKKIKSDDVSFLALNLIGGLLLIFYSLAKQAWANMVINAVWMIIAVIHLVRYFHQKRAAGNKL
jgi:hypothetical protein